MKVKDLIAALSQYDQEAMVVVNGYEGGYSDEIGIYETEIYLNVYDEWYYGKHGDEYDVRYRLKDIPFEKVDAVIISR